MKDSILFTTSAKNLWHFHAIGVGIIFNYQVHSKQVITTSEFTGKIIEVKDYYQEGGLTKKEFKESCTIIYKEMIANGTTITDDYKGLQNSIIINN